MVEGGVMAPLISLPNELLHGVFKWVAPEDLSSLSRTCHALHHFIRHNRALFKAVYLKRLDNPVERKDGVEPDWEMELQTVVRLEKICACDQIEKKRSHLTFVADAISNLLRTATPHKKPSLNVELLANLFEDKSNQDAFLCNSSLFERARMSNSTLSRSSFEERQLSAKLHCFWGKPIELVSTPNGIVSGRTRSSSRRTYPYACSKVYDLRNYTDNTMWGPFADDGSHHIDWEKVEAIMVILGHNLPILGQHTDNRFCKEIWAQPFIDAVPDSLPPHLPAGGPAGELDLLDPYNVSGTYMRVVCFLDYNELFLYNFVSEQPPIGEPRPPLDTSEAIRIISMELIVTKIEPPGETDGQDLPVVHFRGTSRSMHESWDPNANSNIRGTVRLTPHGDVRWTSFSIYHGEERWRSEGIQVGGLRAARGVIGNWFDKDYDVHGPAGPTAFWKMSNKIFDHNPNLDDDHDDEDDEDFETDEDFEVNYYEVVSDMPVAEAETATEAEAELQAENAE